MTDSQTIHAKESPLQENTGHSFLTTWALGQFLGAFGADRFYVCDSLSGDQGDGLIRTHLIGCRCVVTV